MPCRTCTDCGIRYPRDDQFKECGACGEFTVYTPYAMEEPGWATRAAAIAARLNKLAAEKLYEVPDVDVQIQRDDDGLLWINAHEAIRAGCTLALDQVMGSVIAVGPADENPDGPDCNLYEVICYVEAKRAYWIKPLRVPDYA